MLLQTGNADVSQIFDDDEPTVEKATLDAHIAEVFWIDLITLVFKLKYYSSSILKSENGEQLQNAGPYPKVLKRKVARCQALLSRLLFLERDR